MPHVCLVCFPRFQMLAYVLATETLRIANKHVGRPLFTWETRTATGRPLAASNGAVVSPDRADWGDGDSMDLVLICAGYDPLVERPAGLGALLARADRSGAVIGGLDTGAAVLARLGYLAGRRAVLHHEAEAGFRESWPDIAVESALYCLDGGRLTAAGGVATADAMLAWIAETQTEALAEAVADDMASGGIRPGGAPQRRPRTQDPVLGAMLRIMHETLAAPIGLEEVAARAGVSLKHLRARCRKGLGRTPGQVYLSLRLETALDLLRGTELPIGEVALATGFETPAGFSKAFRAAFDAAPRSVRAGARAQALGRATVTQRWTAR